MPKKKKKADPKKVPLGSGLADRAKTSFTTRPNRIEAVLNAANKGQAPKKKKPKK